MRIIMMWPDAGGMGEGIGHPMSEDGEDQTPQLPVEYTARNNCHRIDAFRLNAGAKVSAKALLPDVASPCLRLMTGTGQCPVPKHLFGQTAEAK